MNAQYTEVEVKVGRWTYPGRELVDGTTIRNTKRDGSGEWVNVDGTPYAETEAPADEKLGALRPEQLAMLTALVRSADGTGRHFDFFDEGLAENSGIWFEHCAQQTANPIVARKALRGLEKAGYVEIGELDTDMGVGIPADRWMAITQAAVDAAPALPAEVNLSEALGEAKSGHSLGGGNQTKKPGKSTWKIGDPCPQGHKLTTDTLYVMPSGRKQCKACRAEMPSRKH